MLVPVRTSVSLCGQLTVEHGLYERKVDVDMLKARRLQRLCWLTFRALALALMKGNTQTISQHSFYGVQHIYINLSLIQPICMLVSVT